MSDRKKVPLQPETDVLTNSRRKCCMCFWLNSDMEVKRGQIAHLDDDRDNNELDNLAWLCIPHHDEYDSTPRQSKGFKINEVKLYRNKLYEVIVQQDARHIGDDSPGHV